MQDGKHVILCVDDDEDILASLRVVLEAGGYAVVAARSATTGLETFVRERPDAVLIDLMMEHVDSGMSLARQLRAADAAVPLYFLSSVGDYLHDTADVGEAGANGVFQKPLQPSTLLTVLDTRLGRLVS